MNNILRYLTSNTQSVSSDSILVVNKIIDDSILYCMRNNANVGNSHNLTIAVNELKLGIRTNNIGYLTREVIDNMFKAFINYNRYEQNSFAKRFRVKSNNDEIDLILRHHILYDATNRIVLMALMMPTNDDKVTIYSEGKYLHIWVNEDIYNVKYPAYKSVLRLVKVLKRKNAETNKRIMFLTKSSKKINSLFYKHPMTFKNLNAINRFKTNTLFSAINIHESILNEDDSESMEIIKGYVNTYTLLF